MVVIFRMGIFIPVPGVDASKLVSLTSNGGTLFGFYDMISGGAFSKFSIFAIGVMSIHKCINYNAITCNCNSLFRATF